MKKILLFLILIILLTGCGKKVEEDTRMYSQNEMLNYLDNIGYNLRGKYQIIISNPDRLTLRINNTNLDFDLWQEYGCVKGYSKMGLCDKKAYTISTNFLAKAEEYFINDYQKNNNYNDIYCFKTYTDKTCNKIRYNLESRNDIMGFVQYINNFINYLNNQISNGIITDYTLDYTIFIHFNSDPNKVITIDLNKINNKYTIILNPIYNLDNSNLLSYINDYVNKYNPFMDYVY